MTRVSTPSKCPKCLRTTPHVHYSTLHESLVILGLLLILTIEGVMFISGFVKGSTRLSLPNDQIQAYTVVAEKTNELLAPYEFQKDLAVAFDLAALVVAITSAATLHYRSKTRDPWHALLTITAAGVFAVNMIVTARYRQLISEALLKLPNLVSSNTLYTAGVVQEKFDIASGFWGSSTITLMAGVLSWIALGVSIVAFITSKVVTDYHPQSIMLDEKVTVPHLNPVNLAPTQPTPASIPPKVTKFCRYCGAKIPRTSKYCEECGQNVQPV